MSTFSAACDALVEDLVDNVPALAVEPENVHRYEEAFPEQLVSDGARHLAVYPTGDGFDTSVTDGAPLGAHLREQVFAILVWEPAPDGSRAVGDPEGAAAMLDLYEAVLARLYVTANQTMAGAWKQWFVGAETPRRTLQVRYFRAFVRRHDTLAFS